MMAKKNANSKNGTVKSPDGPVAITPKDTLDGLRVRMDRVEQDIKGMQRSWEKWIEWIWAIIGPIIVAIILRKMGWM